MDTKLALVYSIPEIKKEMVINNKGWRLHQPLQNSVAIQLLKLHINFLELAGATVSKHGF